MATNRTTGQLAALARIARLKADQELSRFAEVRRQAATLEQRVAGLEAELICVAEGAAGLQVDANPATAAQHLRLTHALTRQLAIEREAARADRAGHASRFALARSDAARAFGRAEVVAALHRRLVGEATSGRD